MLVYSVEAQSHVLGIYRHGAEEGKRLQQRLKRVWRQDSACLQCLLQDREVLHTLLFDLYCNISRRT